MIRRYNTALRLGLLAVDAISAIVLFVVLSRLLLGTAWVDAWRHAGFDALVVAIGYAALWVGSLWLHDLYRLRARWWIRTEVLDLLRADLLVAVATFATLFLFKLPDVSRRFLIALFVVQFVVTVALRISIRIGFAVVREHGRNLHYMVVVGTGPEARRFADRVERRRELGLRVVGHLAIDASERRTEVGGRAVLGTVDAIEEILHGRVVDEVAICLPSTHVGRIEPITRLCEEEGKVVRIPVDEFGYFLPGGRLEEFDGIPVLSLVYGPDRVVGLIAKRLLDIGFAILAAIFLSPLLVGVALLINLLDGGPVLFRQTRVGLHGRPFEVVKFRSMVTDAEARLAELATRNEIKGHAFKLTDDPRLTRVGRFLRATSLDELPQLWNVVRGEMSLVGPRPPLPSEVEGYDIWHRRRLSMKPGITGLWQVQARREADFDRWVELDLAYIDRWSIWLDLKIMARTIPAMLQGR